MKKTLTIRLDPGDYARLKDRAWQAKMSLEGYARGRLLYGDIPSMTPTPPVEVPKPQVVDKDYPHLPAAPTALPERPALAAKRIRDEKGNRMT